MDFNIAYQEFCELWALLHVSEQYANRKTATFRLWSQRSAAAHAAMVDRLRQHGAPYDKNPYFWVQDFPEPEPTDWNGRVAPEPTEIACWNGKWGMYTHTDIRRFGLQTKN